MLEIKNYSYEYFKNKEVIHNIDLKVKEGDIYAFLGRNGAGKSTTIKSIVGINNIKEGDILLNKVSIIKEPLKYKMKISFVPDTPMLYENIKGIDYLNFIADIYEVGTEDREDRIKKYATQFEIYKALDDLISSYSHGMKQKLVIVASLIHDFDLYVLDEPFVGLDPEATYNLKQIIKDLSKEGKIIFFSTHVLDVAESLCNKVAIIDNGKIIIDDDMDKVIKKKSLEDFFMDLLKDE